MRSEFYFILFVRIREGLRDQEFQLSSRSSEKKIRKGEGTSLATDRPSFDVNIYSIDLLIIDFFFQVKDADFNC